MKTGAAILAVLNRSRTRDTDMKNWTLYHTDGASYTGTEALDRLWAEIAAGDSLSAISPDLAAAAHCAIDDAAPMDIPLAITPDFAHRIINAIPNKGD